MDRYIIVGDIHGCAKTLEKLLKKVNLNIKTDNLIFLGDLFDRGPNSLGVLKKCLYLKKAMSERFNVIMGNHEDMMLNRKDAPHLWAINGNEATLKSFRNRKSILAKADEFIKDLPLWQETDDFICVHAGLVSEEVRANGRDTFLWDRNAVYRMTYNGKLAVAGHTPLVCPVHICDGNYTCLEFDTEYPLPKRGIIDVDTCCFAKNKLTALVICEKKMILRSENYSE